MKQDMSQWVSIYLVTPQCSDCNHVLEEGRMCSCDLAVPGFPLNNTCKEFESANSY